MKNQRRLKNMFDLLGVFSFSFLLLAFLSMPAMAQDTGDEEDIKVVDSDEEKENGTGLSTVPAEEPVQENTNMFSKLKPVKVFPVVFADIDPLLEQKNLTVLLADFELKQEEKNLIQFLQIMTRLTPDSTRLLLERVDKDYGMAKAGFLLASLHLIRDIGRQENVSCTLVVRDIVSRYADIFGEEMTTFIIQTLSENGKDQWRPDMVAQVFLMARNRMIADDSKEMSLFAAGMWMGMALSQSLKDSKNAGFIQSGEQLIQRLTYDRTMLEMATTYALNMEVVIKQMKGEALNLEATVNAVKAFLRLNEVEKNGKAKIQGE